MKKITTLFIFSLVITLIGCENKNTVVDDEVLDKENSLIIVDHADREIFFDKVPNKIIPLGYGELDIIYKLGHKAVGRPNGDSPNKEAADLPEIGSTHTIDLEKISALNAEVILGNYPMNMKDVNTLESLNKKVVLSSSNSVKEITEQITLFGNMLEREEKASELVNNIESHVKKVHNPNKKPVRSLLIYGAPGTNMAALPNSLSGNILEIAGGENIAGDFKKIEDYPQYAQLNAERIIEADPEVIFLMSHGDPLEVKKGFLKDMEQNAGWSKLSAVKNDLFIILPPDLFGTNPGTRVTESIDFLVNTFSDMDE